MSPTTAYQRLNKLLWLGRLPNATVVLVDNATIPHLHGITLHDGKLLFLKPIVILNRRTPWAHTLLHEMLHVAEPELNHGQLFNTIVSHYWRIAKKKIKGLEAEHV